MDLSKIRKKLKEKQKEERASEAAASKKEGSPEAAAERTTEGQSGITSLPGEARDAGAPAERTPEQAGPARAEGTAGEDRENPINIAEFLVFILAGEYYAFRLSHLHEILKEQIVTAVPKMPDHIRGITSLRGKIVPIMDLKRRLAIEGGTEVKRKKKQMLILKGPKGLIGVTIDRVVGVKRIDESLITEPPSHLDENQVSLIDAVMPDQDLFISILNVEEVFHFQPFPLGRRA